MRGGLKAGIVKTSAYSAPVPDAAKAKADAIKAKFMGDGFAIFAGPIKDNKGSTVIDAGVVRAQTDIELEKMGYLVEGVIGSTT